MDTKQYKELESLFRKILGNQIRKRREALNLTQSIAAERIGCSEKHFGRLERGEKTPNSFTLALIQLELGVSSDEYLPELKKVMQTLNDPFK